MKNRIILTDADGVILDWEYAFDVWMQQHGFTKQDGGNLKYDIGKRYGIDNSQRTLHGALLDAEILAEIYLAMTGGQIALSLEQDDDKSQPEDPGTFFSLAGAARPVLPVVSPSASELEAHIARLEDINKASSGNCRWPMDPSP